MSENKAEEQLNSLQARIDAEDWDKVDILIAKLLALWPSLTEEQKQILTEALQED